MLRTVNRSEPRQTELTARLASQGAMLEELRSVLPLIQPETAREDLRQVIVQDNVLQRASLVSREMVFNKLSLRYFPVDAPRAVARFIRAMQTTPEPQAGALLAYVMLSWNDALVFALGCNWLAPRLSQAGYTAETSDIEREMERMADESPAVVAWNAKTRRRIAQHYLGLLRDCGYATGSLTKTLRRPSVPPDVVLFAAELILGGGEPATKLPGHPLFQAMGLSVQDVVTALTELRQQGRVDFAVQGNVVRLEVHQQDTQ